MVSRIEGVVCVERGRSLGLLSSVLACVSSSAKRLGCDSLKRWSISAEL